MKTVRLPAALWLAFAGYGALAQPEIGVQPADTSVSLGATTQFAVSVRVAASPLTYQWWFNDGALDPVANPSAARARLSLTNVTLGNAGAYYVVVSDTSGSVKSRTATLDVDPQFTKFTEGPVVKDHNRFPVGAWADYDGDGDMDLLVVSGCYTGGCYNHLYRNDGGGVFTDISAAVPGPDRPCWPAWADADNDGDLDLWVGGYDSGFPAYYVNRGQGGLSPQIPTASWTANHVAIRGSGIAWADYNGDGYVDAAVGFHGPQGGDSTPNSLLRNTGDGRFEVVVDSGFAKRGQAIETLSWIDYDGDGDPDLFGPQSGDNSRHCLLFENVGGALQQVLSHPLVAEDGHGGIWLGAYWADYDNDGDSDVYIASFGGGRLFRNLGGGDFERVTGVLDFAGAHAAWADYDNDGALDLYVAGYDQKPPTRLFRGDGQGGFAEVLTGSPANEPAALTVHPSWADVNGDGFLDLFVATDDQDRLFYLNNGRDAGNANHWLKTQLVGTASNRSAIGARVRVKATIRGQTVWQMRQVTADSTTQELVNHFGLGDATVAEVIRVEWPSGNVQELSDQAVDRVLKITEPIRIQPPRPSASLGGSVTLTNALGAGTYQWQFNGVDLAGETKRTLTLTNLQAAQQGRYSLVVTAADDTRTATNHAYLTIDTQFTKLTEGPAATDLGCSWISSSGDFDGDGYSDLAVLRYPASQSAVYRNNGDGTFTTVPDIPWQTGQGDSWGLWGDFDNDGHQDFVSQRANQPASVYFGDGHGTFTARQLQLGASWSIAVADYDQDGFLDLYGSFSGHLLRNNGDRTFTRMTSQPACRLPIAGTWGGALWADYDDDGALDLFCANNQGATYLYHNNGQGCFTAVPSPVIGGEAIAGAWGDYDNDGRLDLCAASFGSISHFYRNLGEGRFEPAKTGVTIQGVHNSAVWADYDNDGWLDLFLTGIDKALYRNLGNGTLSRVHIGSIATEPPGAGAATINGLWFDYNNDGFLDLYITAGDDYGTTRTPSFLYRNNGNSNTWLRVKLIGTVSNRDGVGAKVRVRAGFASKVYWQRRDITGGDVYNGHHLIAHFGLGNAVRADLVQIEWPSGTVQELRNVPVNQMLTVTEPPALEALGEGRLRLLCWARQNYELEVSDDLDTWTSLGVVATDVNRPVVLDPGAAQRPYRFYRTKGL